MAKINSPIKYYGGKSYMTKTILENFPDEYHLYVEGFGGGASILFAKSPTPLEIYNDLGDNVYSLFSVLSDSIRFQKLKERMDLTFYSRQIRDESRSQLERNDLSVEDRAYYFLCANRMSFNGVGGFSTTLLARRNMCKSTSDFLSMIDRLPEIHNRLSSTIVEHLDIFKLIEKYDREDTFFYLDPPYVKSTRSSTTNYEKEMTDDDHRHLIDVLLECKGKILLSGYNHPIYDKLLTKFTRLDFPSNNASSSRVESLWKNY